MAAPTFLTAWIVLLICWLVPAVWLLSTDVGRQAVVDERVRLAEALGTDVDDAQYDAWQARPPYLVYAASGGRLLLTPPVTLLVAGALVALARAAGGAPTARAALAISVHASVPLVVRQALAVPLSYARESVTSPTNLAVFLPVEDGSLAARTLGGIDLFALWWVWLLAAGLAALTGQPAHRHFWRLAGVYAAIVMVVAMAMAIAGGS